MNILITGGNGKLGQNIVTRLKEKNNIILLTRNIEKTEKIFNKYKNIYSYQCDLENNEDISNAISLIMQDFNKMDIVINNEDKSICTILYMPKDNSLYEEHKIWKNNKHIFGFKC